MTRSKNEEALWVNVVGGLLVAGVLGVIGWATGWLTALPSAVWNHLTGTVTVAIWVLYALGACAFAVVAGGLVMLVLWLRQAEWQGYTDDQFFGARWNWSYRNNRISDLRPLCPTCQTVLVGRLEGDGFIEPISVQLDCERCAITHVRHNGDQDSLFGAVRRQIDRNIRTNDWQQQVPP